MLRVPLTIALACAVFAAGPSLAYHCPQMIQQLEDLIAQHPKLTSSQLAEVRKLEAEGTRQHFEGNHAVAMATIAKAIKLVNSSTSPAT